MTPKYKDRLTKDMMGAAWKPRTLRERMAAVFKCGECHTQQAQEMCGCWIQGLDRECKKPLCRECADVRLGIWRCKGCSKKKECEQ